MFLLKINLLSITLILLAIYFLFRLLHLLAKKMLPGKELKEKLKKILFFSELFVWIAFLYRITEYFKSEKPVLSVITGILLILIAVWAFLFVLKDYFAGLYFKIFENYHINNRISFEQKSGKIIAFKNRYLILQTTEGNLKIPYSKLFNTPINLLPEKNEEEFLLQLNTKSENLSTTEIETLKKRILLLPWINMNYPPEINLLHEDNKQLVEIKLVLIDAQYKTNAKNYLEKIVP